MKKFLLPLAMGLLAGTFVASADDTTWTSNSYEGATWSGTVNGKEYKAYNWMEALPDNMLVAHVSIPGTHDSASGHEWESVSGPGCSTTQACEIPEMLARGIRAWDFRPGIDGESEKATAYCYHGIDQLKVTLQQAFTWLTSYLTSHPSEFFVVHLFRGNVYASKSSVGYDSAEARATLNKKINEILQGDKYIEFSPNLTVGQARGKIVVLRRDRVNYLDIPFAGYMDNWDTDFNVDNPVTVYRGSNADVSTIIHVQDISEGDDTVLATKQEHCKALIDWAQTQTPPQKEIDASGFYNAKWVLNFTSIDNSGSKLPTDNTNGYKGGASIMNPRMKNYINENMGRGPLGIFLSDYVLRTSTKRHSVTDDYRYTVEGDQLVYAIIQNNFAKDITDTTTPESEKKTVAERFTITDTSVLDPEPEVNQYEGQQVFLRNVATGLYLAGGANYGSHVMVDRSGHKVEICNTSTPGVYTLKTIFGSVTHKSDGNMWMDGTGTALKASTVHYNAKTYIRYDFSVDGVKNALTVIPYEGGIGNYFDRPTHYVDPRVVNGVDPMQLWEIVTYDDRIKEIKEKANPDRPMDCSFLLHNFGFGNSAGTDNWKITKYKANGLDSKVENGQFNNGNGALYYVTSASSVGGYGDRSKFDMTTTVSNLWKGKYRITCQAYSSTWQEISYKFYTGTAENQKMEGTVVKRDEKGKLSNDDKANAGQWFHDSETNGRIQNTIEAVDNATLNLEFHKPSNTSAGAFLVDNFRIEYLGDNPDKTTIQLDFPEHYNTFMLPFNATATELNANKIYVFKVNKLLPRSEEVSYKDAETQETIKETYKYHLADLNYDNPITEIEANVPYVAVNEDIPKSVAQLNNIATTSNHAPAKAPATKLFSFTGYPTNYLNEYTDENKILTGVHEADVVADEHYVQGTNTQQGYQYFRKDEGSGHKAVAAHRTYIKSTSPDATEDLILFDDDTKITTGVEDVVEEAEAVTAETPTDVYTISGMIVRSQVPYAEALRDLPRGIYIVRAGSRAHKVAL